jgi:hypothetical protein
MANSIRTDPDAYRILEKYQKELITQGIKGASFSDVIRVMENRLQEKSKAEKKIESDFEEIRKRWLAKNQQGILDILGKQEPNWQNILAKNPDMRFDNSKDLKAWVLAKLGKAVGQVDALKEDEAIT